MILNTGLVTCSTWAPNTVQRMGTKYSAAHGHPHTVQRMGTHTQCSAWAPNTVQRMGTHTLFNWLMEHTRTPNRQVYSETEHQTILDTGVVETPRQPGAAWEPQKRPGLLSA